MRYYFAPMEGITGYIYRNAHHALFHSVDQYFSPFIVANQGGNMKSKELNDILPEHNQGIKLIPQLLTNNAKDFIHVSRKLSQMGYQEINLNLGCPSGTVVSKNKGSGFLSRKEELNAFLEEIFSAAVTGISVKTRIGKDSPDEFYELIEIFNQYPMKELIIHPRIQKDFYKNKPNLPIFRDALTLSKNPVCYNGDLFTGEDYIRFCSEFPSVDTVMIGRGLLANPGLIGRISGHSNPDKTVIRAFHDRIYEAYQQILFGERNVLFKMKEIWFYMIPMFTDYEKYAKKIKKSEKLKDYDMAVSSLFQDQSLIE